MADPILQNPILLPGGIMSWTQDRVALLEKLWKEGKTAKEIAETLGGVTRNAVIGKAHRMSLSGRQATANAAGTAAISGAGSVARPTKTTKSAAKAKSSKSEKAKIESARVRIVAQSQEKLKSKSSQTAKPETSQTSTSTTSSAAPTNTKKASITKSQPKLRSIAPAGLPQDIGSKTRPANKNNKTISAPPEGGVQLQDLTDRMCKWPHGDPKEPGFHFCGARSAHGLPYCEHHANMAYQANKKSAVLNPESFENNRPRNDDDDDDGQIITI